MKQCKSFTWFNEWEQVCKEIKEKKRIFAWCITYLNEWKPFPRQFFLSASTSFSLIVFLLCLHFCLLSNFEIIRCIVKLLLAIRCILIELRLKKENLKRSVWRAPELWHTNRYTGLQNGLDTSLVFRWISSFLKYDWLFFTLCIKE